MGCLSCLSYGLRRVLLGSVRLKLVGLVAMAACVLGLVATAEATNTDYCDGVWNTTAPCFSPYAYSYVANYMSYNQGINYSAYGNMTVDLVTPDQSYAASASGSAYEAYLCFTNQLDDVAFIQTTHGGGDTIAGHDDNYPRSGCVYSQH